MAAGVVGFMITAGAVFVVAAFGGVLRRREAVHRREHPGEMSVICGRLVGAVSVALAVVAEIGLVLALALPLVGEDQTSPLDGAPEALLWVVAVGLLLAVLVGGFLVVRWLPQVLAVRAIKVDPHRLRFVRRWTGREVATIEWDRPFTAERRVLQRVRWAGFTLRRSLAADVHRVEVYDLAQDDRSVTVVVDVAEPVGQQRLAPVDRLGVRPLRRWEVHRMADADLLRPVLAERAGGAARVGAGG